MMDVLPTLAALGGAALPEDRKLDGIDVSGVLLGDPAAHGHAEFCYFRGLTLEAVRQGPWKLHFGVEAAADAGQKQAGQKNAKQKQNAPGARPVGLQLFNLETDPGESRDISAANPEVVRKLQALLPGIEADLGTSGAGPGVRTPGKVDNPLPLIDADGRVRADAAGTVSQFP